MYTQSINNKETKNPTQLYPEIKNGKFHATGEYLEKLCARESKVQIKNCFYFKLLQLVWTTSNSPFICTAEWHFPHLTQMTAFTRTIICYLFLFFFVSIISITIKTTYCLLSSEKKEERVYLELRFSICISQVSWATSEWICCCAWVFSFVKCSQYFPTSKG